LNEFVQNHYFWKNRLFSACFAGDLTREDFVYIFAQYYIYSKNFTRYIAGVIANCEKDYFRAKLTQNLWEEAGQGGQLSHAQIFRNFLQTTLGIQDLGGIQYADFTKRFVQIYTESCIQSDAVWGSAWLSLGTEGIVSKMYQILVEGMLKAGLANEELEFFHIHIGCDDEHSATLAELMCSYSDRPGWFELCKRSADQALSARAQFFDYLYDALIRRLDQSLLQPIKARKSLAAEIADFSALKSDTFKQTIEMYRNEDFRLNVGFAVDRLPFPLTQVLDPRVVRIPPGKNNEKHRHAHETVFYIIQGHGKVLIDNQLVDVSVGDTVFIPRWCVHQSQNTGDQEMRILAVTDFGLTSRVLESI
jgi:mannose-6-phosphate isomerase-like protein (cupin superfamily)/pyrroloquinoline quinone (PQQ) biosynthesis protein C